MVVFISVSFALGKPIVQRLHRYLVIGNVIPGCATIKRKPMQPSRMRSPKANVRCWLLWPSEPASHSRPSIRPIAFTSHRRPNVSYFLLIGVLWRHRRFENSRSLNRNKTRSSTRPLRSTAIASRRKTLGRMEHSTQFTEESGRFDRQTETIRNRHAFICQLSHAHRFQH